MKKTSYIVFVLICIAGIGSSFLGGSGVKHQPSQATLIKLNLIGEPRPLLPTDEMEMAIKKYSAKYDIPIRYAYGVAYYETRYKGALDTLYDPAKISSAGAQGPMQIMPYVGKSLLEKLGRDEEADTLTHERLRTDIDLNVELSMYLLQRLHKRYPDWKTVFGAYNTGKPIINNYAISVFNFSPKEKHIK